MGLDRYQNTRLDRSWPHLGHALRSTLQSRNESATRLETLSIAICIGGKSLGTAI